MKKIVYAAIFTLALSTGALLAQEGCPDCDEMQGMGGMSGGGMGMMGMKHGGAMGSMGVNMILMHSDDLKLSSEQVSRLEKIKADSSRDTIKRQADIRIAYMDVIDALRGPNPNFGNAKNAMKKVSELTSAAANAAIDTYANAYGVLTADQKVMLPKLGPAGRMRGMGMGR